MSFNAILRAVVDGPEYMIPCPMCSWFERQDGGPDIVRSPYPQQARGTGVWMMLPCCLGGDFLKGSTEADLAGQWRELVSKAYGGDSPKLLITLEKMERLGYLPTGFEWEHRGKQPC